MRSVLADGATDISGLVRQEEGGMSESGRARHRGVTFEVRVGTGVWEHPREERGAVRAAPGQKSVWSTVSSPS